MNSRRTLIIVTTFLLTVILPDFALGQSPYNNDDVQGKMMHSFYYEPHGNYHVKQKQELKTEKPFLLKDPSSSVSFSPPPNDNFADRIAVFGNPVTVNGNNINATVEPGEPLLHKQHGSNSVWWTWTPSTSGIGCIDTDGSGFDTYLAVYSGTAIGGLVELARDDDGGEGLQSKAFLPVQAGVSYQVAVFGYAPVSEGAITLNFNVFLPPPNDNFADAVMIAGTSGIATGYNFFASSESGELPGMPTGNGHNSVWWKWTAPVDGTFGFDTYDSEFDTVLGIFSGASVDTLTRIAWNDDAAGLMSYAHFNATAGATYYISVAGYSASKQGSIDLHWYPDHVTWHGSTTSAFTNQPVECAANGSILSYTIYDVSTEFTGSNMYGTGVSIISNYVYMLDIIIKDKKKFEVVNTDTIDPSITGSCWIIDFDGKQLLAFAPASSGSVAGTLLLYKISKKGLTRAGSYAVGGNHVNAWLTKAWVYQKLYDWGSDVNHVVALHRRLKKPLWQASIPAGDSTHATFDNGVVVSHSWITNVYVFTITKKGKPYGGYSLNTISFIINNKGSVIYWSPSLAGPGPLSLASRTGKILADNLLLDSMTNFAYIGFSGKLLYMRKTVDTSNTTIRTYTVTSKFKLNGNRTNVMNYAGAQLDQGKAYVVLFGAGNDITILEYKKKLDKVAWENTGPTLWYGSLGNGVFYRGYSPAPGTTTYTIFKRDKNIVTHDYTVP